MKVTVKDIQEKLNLKPLTQGELEREVNGCYIGDLLSWVMGRASEGEAWLTVMGNVNAIAVAVLADISCIILTDNAPLDEEASIRAQQQGVAIFSTEESSYKTAVKIYELLKA